MYFTILIIASISYAIQGYFVVKYSRNISAYTMVLYRWLALWIVMLPLLYLWIDKIYFLNDFIFLIFIASLAGFLWNYFNNLSVRNLPVWLATSIKMGFSVLFSILFWIIFLWEFLSNISLLLIWLILVWILLIKSSKINIIHLKDWNIIKWFIFSIFAWICISYWFYSITVVAREWDPYLAAYFWEIWIWLVALVFSYIWTFYWIQFHKVNFKTFKKIMLVTSPTLIGTSGYLIAIKHIPIWVAWAVLSSNIVILTILAYLFMKEKINLVQVFWILIILLSVIWIKLII